MAIAGGGIVGLRTAVARNRAAQRRDSQTDITLLE
jgi:glycine/D-amino acid oxidase-like deaminating enzyme